MASNKSDAFAFRGTETRYNKLGEIRRRPLAKNPIASGIFGEPSRRYFRIQTARENARPLKYCQTEVAFAIDFARNAWHWVIYFKEKRSPF